MRKTIADEPRGIWMSGRVLISTVFNAGTQLVEVAGSGISALAVHAETLEHTARVDCGATMIAYRGKAIHDAATGMVDNMEAVHVARGTKGPFDRTLAYAECAAKLETNVPA